MEEASQLNSQENQFELNNPSGKMDFPLLQIIHENIAMVGLEALERANFTLEDFFLFMYLDCMNEKILYIPTEGLTTLAKGFEEGWAETFANMLENDPFRPLLNVLECWGLLTERIRKEFRYREEYWALKRKLCRALVCKMEVHMPHLSSL
ncbi:hypothetical protein REPUB_Repub12eG0189200 [Reevesia pubescens]